MGLGEVVAQQIEANVSNFGTGSTVNGLHMPLR
jgi:hypothetical protein